MGKTQKQRSHLRLVASGEPSPKILRDYEAQRTFAFLTQRLVDIAIEITEIMEGDPDLELSGDEWEDSDGI